jgi:deoxyribodipyrimidine photo-lyase
MPDLAVLTRDLRIHDNPVLAGAGTDAVPLFVADPRVDQLHDSPNRRAFLAESLSSLDEALRGCGTRLVYRRGPWLETVLGVAAEAGAEVIHIAADVSGFAQRRLEDLRRAATIPVIVHDSVTVIRPGKIHPVDGDIYRVFTPYYRRWLSAPRRAMAAAPHAMVDHGIVGDEPPGATVAGTSPGRERGGEHDARSRFEAWLPLAGAYHDDRDVLGDTGTSRVSASLHFGLMSPLEISSVASDLGADAFVRQIAWRDFNHQLLWGIPAASRHDIRDSGWGWRDDPVGLEAWKGGITGYPVVDAGMRQLVATGWMHNRARMITASFLTKDLMIDWRVGASWFMHWLTDGDVANNQLGWQWVAGTGTDTNPTRIFNPTLQSRRFDPDGTYIRRWVPELRDVGRDEIHDPGPLARSATGYPEPIVDHREAIRSYKHARGWA